MTHVVISLGSNQGDRLGYLERAIASLGADIDVTAVSSVWQTAPWGEVDQPAFLNAVLVGETDLKPDALLERVQEVEAALGRRRRRRWGPRVIDLDLILVGDVVCASDRLTLPHPLAAARAFVLAPWAEVEPGAVLPGHGPVVDLLAAIGDAGVQRLPDAALARSAS